MMNNEQMNPAELPAKIEAIPLLADAFSFEDGNTIIAVFDGKEIIKTKKYGLIALPKNVVEKSEHKICFLKYHSSWDWLMRVVTKLEKMGYCVTQEEKACLIEDGNNDFKVVSETRAHNRISATYKAVVEVISTITLPVSKR